MRPNECHDCRFEQQHLRLYRVPLRPHAEPSLKVESAPYTERRDHLSRKEPDWEERLVNSAARFARKGHTSPFGKLTPGGLGQIRLGSETEELVRTAAARAGLPIAEFIREYIEVGFHGRDEVERRRTIRLDLILAVVPKPDGNGREG